MRCVITDDAFVQRSRCPQSRLSGRAEPGGASIPAAVVAHSIVSQAGGRITVVRTVARTPDDRRPQERDMAKIAEVTAKEIPIAANNAPKIRIAIGVAKNDAE